MLASHSFRQKSYHEVQRTASRRVRHAGVAPPCRCCGHTLFPANRLDLLFSSTTTSFGGVNHRGLHIDGCFSGDRSTHCSSPKPVSIPAVLADYATHFCTSPSSAMSLVLVRLLLFTLCRAAQIVYIPSEASSQ